LDDAERLCRQVFSSEYIHLEQAHVISRQNSKRRAFSGA
jgi:hypothetical protein